MCQSPLIGPPTSPHPSTHRFLAHALEVLAVHPRKLDLIEHSCTLGDALEVETLRQLSYLKHHAHSQGMLRHVRKSKRTYLHGWISMLQRYQTHREYLLLSPIVPAQQGKEVDHGGRKEALGLEITHGGGSMPGERTCSINVREQYQDGMKGCNRRLTSWRACSCQVPK